MNPEIFDQMLGKTGKKRILVSEGPSSFIPTSEYKGFEHYFKTVRSAKRRKTLRNQRNKINKYENIEWKVLYHIDIHLLNEMEELDRKRSIRGLKGLNFFENPLNKVFLKRILKEFEHDDRIRLFTFQVGDRLCSYELNFSYHKKMLSYQANFDRSFYKDSIGTITQLEAIKYAFENNYEEYDFLTDPVLI